ncbi:S1 family peptidase [Taibaiella helva]|uniref:S1 family peptidase n=1 Tax=Taibaiella helva TaxID=2301235 RepID=UPI000E57E93A|nr:serine protease [Taibaiella helva]
MITEHNISEWAERYLKQELSEAELAQMNRALDADPQLYRHWAQTLDILRTFDTHAQRKEIRNLIGSVAANPSEWRESVPETKPVRVIPFGKYLRTVSAAAALVLFSSLGTMFFLNKKDNKTDQNTYRELRREINNIKHSQSKIIDSLNKNKPAETTEEEIAVYGGTGFALSNDGYIATNYHVVKDANAIYVQTRKGDMRAYKVAWEPNADIAILKLEDKSYRFGKTPLPYNIAKPAAGLGQRVFTIGYPKDEVVYNEGYVSCENGYDGDTRSYQLEMTANPGQSGSPVLDKYGSVIGLITGKQSNTTGTTFAVHADALIELVQSLPKSTGLYLPEHNRMNKIDRTEQVKKMRDYVFSIKVN